MCFHDVKGAERDDLAPRPSSGAYNEKPMKAKGRKWGGGHSGADYAKGGRGFYSSGGNAGATGAAGAMTAGIGSCGGGAGGNCGGGGGGGCGGGGGGGC